MAAVAVLLSGGGRAGATIINFDDLPNNTIVTNQYPEATFSSNPGFVNWTTAQDLGSSPPNFICTGPASGGIDCAHDVFVDFTNPVNNLRFVGVGVNNTGVVAQVDVFVNGINTATVPMIGQGNPFVPVPVDLTAFPDVTRIAIHDVTDRGGSVGTTSRSTPPPPRSPTPSRSWASAPSA
jgi:hypothetical protein